MNCCLLLHPEINKTRDENIEKQLSTDQTNENTPVAENSTDVDEIATAGLNRTEGKAGTIMDHIVQAYIHLFFNTNTFHFVFAYFSHSHLQINHDLIYTTHV